MRCARCGNENSEGNRFCGMCGATLLTTSPVASAPAPGAAPRSSTLPSPVPSAPTPPQNPPAPRTPAPVSHDAPIISGPSFLGLNEPAPRKRASLSADPHASPSSSNLDYLLEDEEEPRRGGGGKFILILLALALAVGFGYLRWKNQGFGWLGSHTSKPSAAAQNSDATDTSSTAPPASSSTSAPTTPAAAQPATDANSPAGSPATGSPTTNPAPGTTPASAAPATGDATPSNGATNSPADSASVPSPAAKEPAPATPPTTNPKPNKPAHEPPPKPPAAIKPTPHADPVSEAQKYLYGRGAAQDCERGLRLLKPAVNQSNPKAMIEMGALYSAGLCTPHDLPTAYRWFALALRKDPENQAVQADLQKLWGEMTQPERQLAIKLSR